MKAQVTVEVIMAVMLVLLLFIAILFFVLQKNTELSFVKEDYENQIVCEKISSIVSYIYFNSETTSIDFVLEKDVNVLSNSANIGEYYCRFNAVAQPVDLTKGNVRAENVNGVVVIANT